MCRYGSGCDGKIVLAKINLDDVGDGCYQFLLKWLIFTLRKPFGDFLCVHERQVRCKCDETSIRWWIDFLRSVRRSADYDVLNQRRVEQQHNAYGSVRDVLRCGDDGAGMRKILLTCEILHHLADFFGQISRDGLLFSGREAAILLYLGK